LQEGREPKNVVRDPQQNVFRILSTRALVPRSKDWKDFAREMEAKVRI
jgi:hypothetical protein